MKRKNSTPSKQKKTPARASKQRTGGPARPKAPRAKTEVGSPDAPPENPEAKALSQKIASLLGDKKAVDIVILDVRGKTSYADYFVIASGESERQVSSMADHVETSLKAQAIRPVGTEGYDTGHWVLLDYGEVVAHLFYTEVRSFYDLEGLWADVPKEKVA